MGAAHSYCNVRRRKTKFLPMFCHNAKNYDTHFLIQALKQTPVFEGKRVHVSGLAENTEKFKTLTINHITFLDSAAFLNCKLEHLASDLAKTPNYPYSILDQVSLYKET